MRVLLPLTQVTDGEGQVTGFRYDGLARKTRTIWDEAAGPVEKEEQATWDGLVQTGRTDAKQQKTAYHYDALNRLEDVVYEPDANGQSSHPDNRHLGAGN